MLPAQGCPGTALSCHRHSSRACGSAAHGTTAAPTAPDPQRSAAWKQDTFKNLLMEEGGEQSSLNAGVIALHFHPVLVVLFSAPHHVRMGSRGLGGEGLQQVLLSPPRAGSESSAVRAVSPGLPRGEGHRGLLGRSGQNTSPWDTAAPSSPPSSLFYGKAVCWGWTLDH